MAIALDQSARKEVGLFNLELRPSASPIAASKSVVKALQEL